MALQAGDVDEDDVYGDREIAIPAGQPYTPTSRQSPSTPSLGGGSSQMIVKLADATDTLPCDVCTRNKTTKELINTGCSQYPKYRCRPCHNSARALDRAATSQGQTAVDTASVDVVR